MAFAAPYAVSLRYPQTAAIALSRRSALFSTLSIFAPIPSSSLSVAADADDTLRRIESLLLRASEAWGKALDPNYPNPQASLEEACKIIDTIVALDPDHTEWLEARGQVRIDAKRFEEAVSDFSEVVRRNPTNSKAYSGRALAYEGLAEWQNAVQDYTKALEEAKVLTGVIEPYIVNSRGNAFASLGQYQDALRDYLLSFQGFQRAKQLDGAIYAASNAALMHIQLGDEMEGMRELMGVARRAPASIDMRAALAALYWSQGLEQAAEDEWHFTCNNINSGQVFDSCALYMDPEWLLRIRRWPPIMVEYMQNFLKLKSSPPNPESK